MDLLELEARLIEFDTTSFRSNLEMVDFLHGVLKNLGMEVGTVASAEGQKANLFASLGPRDRGGLMLAGHMDVVPVEGQLWHTDPFKLIQAEGRFYGRGTADMKSFMAQAILAAEAVRHRKLKLPLQLAFTYDEEVGCHGARRLMAEWPATAQPLPKCAVIGEPTNFQVFRLHKGFCSARVTVKGVEGHSAKPGLGANAIYPAARVVNKLAEVAAERAAVRDMEDLFEVPHTTINVGTIKGGTALNIIPNRCEVLFEYRTMPGQDSAFVLNQVRGFVDEVVLPEFSEHHPDVEILVEETGHGDPMVTPAGSWIETVALELTENRSSGAAPYYTEGAIYNQAGIPTVICGPGDIDQAHRPNEYITRAQLDAGLPLLGRLIERVCLT
ncbi:MAG: acetylornithine deacetylase [bacterium]